MRESLHALSHKRGANPAIPRGESTAWALLAAPHGATGHRDVVMVSVAIPDGREHASTAMKPAAGNILAPGFAALAAALILLAAASTDASRYPSLRVLVVIHSHAFADLAASGSTTTPNSDFAPFLLE
jgi:hypothetical protein